MDTRFSRLSFLGHPTSFLHISYADDGRFVAKESSTYHRHQTLRRLGAHEAASDSKLPHYESSQRIASCSASVLADCEPLHAAEDATFTPGRRFYLAFSALAALSLVVALDGTSLSVALPIISKDIGGQAIDAFWAGTSFLLASTVSLPVYAALSHVFGRKQIMLVAVGLFLIGCLVAGLAHNVAMMLAGRSIQGLGGGGILALTNIVLTDLVPLRWRGNWIGVLGAMWAIGSVSGPVVGGSLSHDDTWPWIFYLNLPFIATSFVLVACFIRLNPVKLGWLEKLRRVDWIGSFVFVASMTSVLVPLTWAGVVYQWTSWRVIVPIGFGILGFVILGYHEEFATAHPIIQKEVFANRSTNTAYLTTGIHGMVLWCLLYYQPLYFMGVRDFSPVLSGVALFPATFTVAPIAIVTGIVITKRGTYRWAIWAGWALTTLGVGFMIAIDAETQLVYVIITDLCAGVGLGSLFPALQFQLQAASSPKHMGSAVAMFAFFRGLGQTLGIAIGGNIFQNVLASELSQQPHFADKASELAKEATALVHWLQNEPPSEAKDAMRTAFTKSLRTVYIAMGCIALAATLASLLTKHYDLNQGLQTEQGLSGSKERREKETAP